VIIQLNPAKWFSGKAGAAAAAPVAAATSAQVQQVSSAAKAEESVVANKFFSVLEAIGKGFEKGLTWAVQYAVPIERLIGLIYPPALPITTEVADATTLIQHAVMLVEQKYAASGVQNGTGQQKLAEVMLLVGPTVTALLSKAGIAPDSSYVESIVSAVVAILNVQQASPALVNATTAAA
jgi:hypothetical protein